MNRVALIAVVLTFSTTAFADDKPASSDPRTVVERYVAAALAGKTDDAVKLAVEGQSPSNKDKIEEFKALVDAKSVRFPTVFVGTTKGQAIAVSEAVKITEADSDGRDTGRLVFALVKSRDQWLVKDIDFRTEANAKEQVEKFKSKNADAKELPIADAKADDDVSASFIGTWHVTSATSSVILSIGPKGQASSILIDKGAYGIDSVTWKSVPGGILVEGLPRFRFWKGGNPQQARVAMEPLPPEVTSASWQEFPLTFFMSRIETKPENAKSTPERKLPAGWNDATLPAEWDETAGRRRVVAGENDVSKVAPAATQASAPTIRPTEERKVLKPEQAEKDRPQEVVTVAFQVESLSRLRGPIAEGQPPYEPIKLDATAKLKDERNKLYVVLVGKALAQVHQLGIDPVAHFQCRTIEVTGKVQYHSLPQITERGEVEILADSYTHYEIVVDCLDNLRVVENVDEEVEADPKAANPQDLTHAEAAKLGITIEVKEIKPKVNYVTINFTQPPSEALLVIHSNKNDWIANTDLSVKGKSCSAWLVEDFTGHSHFRITTSDRKREYRIPVRETGNGKPEPPKNAASGDRVQKLIQAMESFRRIIPDEVGFEEQNGISVKETEPYLLTHLRGVANRLKVETKAECLALLTYLKDPDGKIRWIAIEAIEGVVKSRPDGMSIEVLTDTKSDAHLKMVAKFVELIRKLSDDDLFGT